MRILHCCLSCYYVDRFNYQENLLPRQNKQDGHDVKIIASTEVFKNGRLDYTNTGRYMNEDGIEVVRVPYSKVLPFKVMRKLRFYKGVYPVLENFRPDVIFFHGVSAGELLVIKKYVKKHKYVKLYLDSHETFFNTAKTPISRLIYKYVHGFFLKKAMPYISKLFYVGIESKSYLKKMYHISDSELEWFPLGGIVFEDDIYNNKRNITRESLDLKQEDILFMHSGKMDKEKKTMDILKAFLKTKNDKFKLILIGSFPDDVWSEVVPYIDKDKRISFLGWKNGEELINYLCAADIYLQPGSVSATLQNAICCKCGVLFYPHPGYGFLKHSGFSVKCETDIRKALEEINKNPQVVDNMKKNSEKIGKEILDYKKLASRIYS